MGDIHAKPPVASAARPEPFRLTLRQLPLPAKLVLTCFLLAVGLGYCSAMVQLHLKHSNREGEALPTPDDVVERFSGLKTPNPNDPPPRSMVEELISGDPKAADVSKTNMAPAFLAKSKGWSTAKQGGAAVEAEREGERQAMLAYVRSTDAAAKEAAYKADKFPLPADLQGKPITPDMLTADKAVKIKTLFDKRCQNCHQEQAPDLGDYVSLSAHATPPSTELVDGKWVRSSKQMTVEGLTQSTHAHLLSFAVLFTLTGLIFAFSSYPVFMRSIIGPIVLVAQVADIACWWLARVPHVGPYFALTIMATGGIVGMGLVLQILLSVFNMYGFKGKAVLLFLFLLVLGSAGAFLGPVVKTALDDEKDAAKIKAVTPEVKPTEPPPVKNVPEPPPVVVPKVNDTQTPPVVVPKTNGPETPKVVTPKVSDKPVSKFEKLVMGPIEGAPWTGKGSMAPAFFKKDKDKTDDTPGYSDFIKTRPKAEVDAEREGERLAVKEWVRLDPSERKKAYEADQLKRPAALAGKPVTAKYTAKDFLKIKSILNDRCARCHSKDGDQSDYLLDSYDAIMEYVDGEKKD